MLKIFRLQCDRKFLKLFVTALVILFAKIYFHIVNNRPLPRFQFIVKINNFDLKFYLIIPC